MRAVRAVAVPTGDAVLGLLRPLADALDGAGPALLPVPDGPRGTAVRAAGRPDEPTGDGVALMLPTSGSTGDAKVVELSAAALRASATATHDRLGGPGRWLLPLPVEHVAGWQVLVRSLDAGQPPVVLDVSDPFTPKAFAATAGRLDGDRRYTSLVPTQLHRLLEDPEGTAALRRFDAVLVGGAATPPTLLAAARRAGVRVVTTYGMTETCGGCLYDGVPLEGVGARVDGDGRVLLSGPVLADGYRLRPDLTAAAFGVTDGVRELATADTGVVHDGRLTVTGRLDDVVVTGGRKVAPAAVEAVLGALPGVRDCLVVGVEDPEWGQAVVALVVGDPPPLAEVRSAVGTALGPAAAPREVVPVDALPSRGIGKPDRRAAADLAARRLRASR
jgi:O-succinylbenzoic acid--CoA ligase